MWFWLLGPLRVGHDDGTEVALGGDKQRMLLVALLLESGRAVTPERLIDTLWPDAAPVSARSSLHNLVSGLRRTLRDPDGRILRHTPYGYLIDVRPADVDVRVFEDRLRAATNAYHAQQWPAAATELGAALAVWRGEPLSGLASRSRFADVIARWGEQRLQALEWRIDCALRMGRHTDVVIELRDLVAAHPMREGFAGALMVAHYRSSRQADALAVYRNTREILVTELGVEPGAELRRLHERILRGDPALSQVVAEPVEAGSPPAPAQLPADIADFTGRDKQVQRLCDLIGAAASAPVVIAGVTGIGGIGKTALAVHVAHRIRERFPDGQLYANLRGTDRQPRAADAVLARFLRDLGVPDAAVPRDEEERVVRYRSLLAERRVLVVLDDVRDATQIRPLIPGTPGCAVVVTSRNRLSGLDGATIVELDAMDAGEAHALFARIVGPDDVAAEPAATATVVRACGGFPLAIRIAANRLAARPGWTVRALADRLADERNRLRELNVADLAVRVTFRTSYDALPCADDPDGIDAARAFRLLAMAPGPSVSLPAAAALFGTSEPRAERALETLVDAHLLTAAEPGRYRFHDLLRGYATERADAEETAQVRTDAVHRLLAWYLDGAAAADPLIDHRQQSAGGPRLRGYRDALRWFDTERATLLAAVGRAAEIGAHRLANRLAGRLRAYLALRRRWDELVAVTRIGLAGAQACGDRQGEADALRDLACGLVRRTEYQAAQDALRRASAIYREIGDLSGELMATGDLGNSGLWSGQLDMAAAALEQAMAIAGKLGHRTYEARCLTNLGYVYNELGQHERALTCCERALTIAGEVGDHGLADVHLGRALHGLGRHADATEQLRRALDATEPVLEWQTLALMYLGDVEHDLGLDQAAVPKWRAAYRVFAGVSAVFADQAADRLARCAVSAAD